MRNNKKHNNLKGKTLYFVRINNNPIYYHMQKVQVGRLLIRSVVNYDNDKIKIITKDVVFITEIQNINQLIKIHNEYNQTNMYISPYKKDIAKITRENFQTEQVRCYDTTTAINYQKQINILKQL